MFSGALSPGSTRYHVGMKTHAMIRRMAGLVRLVAVGMIGLVSFVSVAAAQQSGTIRGMVSDEKGKPVSGATVYATQTDSNDGNEKSALTDDRGGFVVSGLNWGKYLVTAEKIEAGYPRTPSKFYGGRAPLVAQEISQKNPVARVKIVFGGKVPAITGAVIDDEASVPISATFLFRYASDPANLLVVETPSNYRILLPAGIGMTLEVSSPNHKTWYYPGTNDAAKKTTLQLSPGQELKLNIRLDNTSEDCACLDRPQRWGLGPDSPAFQWHELQDEARGRACTPHSGPDNMPQVTMAMQ